MKKGQLKIMESIFVLIIFFFLLVFGLGFYAKFSKMETSSDVEEHMETNAREAAQRIKYMPELQCTKGGSYVEADCIDLHKLKAFTEIKGSQLQLYSKYFPDTLINIVSVYPEDKQKTWTVYNYTSNASSSGIIYYLPTTIYNATSEKYYFGYVLVEARY